MHHSLCFNHRSTFISPPCEAGDGAAAQPSFWPKRRAAKPFFVKISFMTMIWNACFTDVAKSSRARAGHLWWHLAAPQHTQALCGLDTDPCSASRHSQALALAPPTQTRPYERRDNHVTRPFRHAHRPAARIGALKATSTDAEQSRPR